MRKYYKLKQAEWVLGLMSGTSADGVDAALLKTNGIRIEKYGPTLFVPYTKKTQEEILQSLGKISLNKYLETKLTNYHIQAVKELMKKSDINPTIIGFHGQTIFHQPKTKTQSAQTFQLGNPQYMADTLKIPVIFDFRKNDIVYGGEGAPLVPLFHQSIINEQNVAIVNIGGVCNITLLDKQGISAGDVAPGCALMNDWMKKHTNETYDHFGKRTLSGHIHHHFVENWMKNEFFKKKIPKSLYRNTFNFAFEDIKELNINDGMATLAFFTSQGILHHTQNVEKLILCGGGRHNKGIIKMLKEKKKVLTIDTMGMDGDFIEAYAFAYLASRSLQGFHLTMPSTTGAKKYVSGGNLYIPSIELGLN